MDVQAETLVFMMLPMTLMVSASCRMAGFTPRLLDDLVPGGVGNSHQLRQQTLLLVLVSLGRDHVPSQAS